MKNKTPSQCSGWGFILSVASLKKLKIKTVRYKKGAIAAPF